MEVTNCDFHWWHYGACEEKLGVPMALVERSITGAQSPRCICQCVILCSMVKTMVRLRMGYAPINPCDGASSELISESFVHSWPATPKVTGLAKRNPGRNGCWHLPRAFYRPQQISKQLVQTFHRKTDSLAVDIDFQYSHLDVLLKLDNRGRV